MLKQSSLLPELNEIKRSILDDLFVVIAVIGFPFLIVTIINIHGEGRFPYFSTTGYLFIILNVIWKRRIPFPVKAWGLILLAYLIGTSGMLSEGLLSDSLYYVIIVSILTSMLMNIRSGIIIALINVLTAITITFLHYSGRLKYNIDIITYFNAPSTFLMYILTAAFFAATGIAIFGRLERYLVDYIRELKEKSGTLKQANVLLENEIAERQRTALSLRKSEDKFKNVFNSIEEGIVLLDSNNRILDVNDGLLRLSGYSRENLLTGSLDDLFIDHEKFTHIDFVANVAAGFNKNELLLKSVRAGEIPVEITIAPYPDHPEITHIMLIKDIREKKETEKRVLHAIITSEEKERSRISQDLHDGLGPLLSATRLYLNSMEVPPGNAKFETIKAELISLTDLSIGSVREISGNLGSRALQTSGLKSALTGFAAKIADSLQMEISIQIPDGLQFLENAEVSIYRVLTELINNSVKYAEASRLEIKIRLNAGEMEINFTDNGKGFDFRQVLDKQKGMGLFNVHSRITSLGGNIYYQTSPGNGVEVKITFGTAQLLKDESFG